MNIDFKSFQIIKRPIHDNNICISFEFIRLLYNLHIADFSKIITKYYYHFIKEQPMKETDIQNKPIIIILFDGINVIIINNKIKKVNNIITLEKTYDHLFDFTNLNTKLLKAINIDKYYLIIHTKFRIIQSDELHEDNYKFINIDDFKPIDNKPIDNKPFDINENPIQNKIHNYSFNILLTISFIELYIKQPNNPNIIFKKDKYYLMKSSDLNDNMIPINYDLINLDNNNIFIKNETNIPYKINYVIFKNGNNIVYYKDNITFNYYNKYMYLNGNNIYILKNYFIELLSYFLSISVSDNTEFFIPGDKYKETNIYIDTYIYDKYIKNEKINKSYTFPTFNIHVFEDNYNQQFMEIDKKNIIEIFSEHLGVMSEDTDYYKLSTTYKLVIDYLNKNSLINNIKKTIDKFKLNNEDISIDEKYTLSIYDYKLENEYYTYNILIDNIYKLPNNKYIYIFETNNNTQPREETRKKIMKIIDIIENPKRVSILGGRNKKYKVYYNDKKNKYYINYENKKRYLSYKNIYKDNKKFYMKIKDDELELYM